MALPKYDKYLYENHKQKTYEQMAIECNASIDTISNRCNKLGIKAMKKKRTLTDFSEMDKVIMDNIHFSREYIAEKLGVKTYMVNNRIASLGIAHFQIKRTVSIDEVIELKEQGLKPFEISRKLNIRPNLVYKRIYQHNQETKNQTTFNVHQYDNWVI